MVLVGAVSFSVLKKFRDINGESSIFLMPILESQLKKGVFGLKIHRHSSGMHAGIVDIVERPTVERVTKLVAATSTIIKSGEKLELTPTATGFHCKKTTITVQVAPCLAWAGGCMDHKALKTSLLTAVSTRDTAVWCTRLVVGGDADSEPQCEYWLVDAKVDTCAFLKAYLCEQRLLCDDRMLAYSVDNRYEPMLEGWAEHGPCLRIFFTKILYLHSTMT